MPPTTVQQKIAKLDRGCQQCKACPLDSLNEYKVCFRHSLLRPKVDLLLIGEAPGKSEHINRRPFIGPAGDMLDSILEEALPDNISYLITNAIRCTPWADEQRSKTRKPRDQEIKACTVHLRDTLDTVKPKHIIALGDIAKKALKLCKVEDFLHLKHPSYIMQARHVNYEMSTAILQIKEYLSRQDFPRGEEQEQ